MDDPANKEKQGNGIPDTVSHTTDTHDRDTHNIRHLMALAAALRRLALDSDPHEAALYLSTAVLLHRRAESLAGLRPQETGLQDRPERLALRKRIDIRI